MITSAVDIRQTGGVRRNRVLASLIHLSAPMQREKVIEIVNQYPNNVYT